MSQSVPFTMPRLPQLNRRGRIAVIAVVVIVLLVLLGRALVHLLADLLWFHSVHAGQVYTRRLATEALLFFLFGLLTAIIVVANVVIAYRVRPAYRPVSPEQRSLERWQNIAAPVRILVVILLFVIVAIAVGAGASTRWATWMQWQNGVSFGIKDPQFHRDVSYFAFTYPMQLMVLGALFRAVVLSILGAAAVHYLYGGLRIATPGERVTRAARAHLSLLLGVFVLLKAAAYWLDRYGLDFSRRGFVDTGASYTDVHAVLPAKTILFAIALICAALFFANVVVRNWTLPAVALGLMVVSAIVIGGIYPLIVQHFSVKPSEADKEAPYITRNINETRLAYGLVPNKDVTTTPYAGTPTKDVAALRTNSTTLPNIRLLDPVVLSLTYQQLQGFKGFYDFANPLDIDRYNVNGTETEQVVSVRDIDLGGLASGQRNWVNDHLVYTHGFGFVSAPGNTVNPSDGSPAFDEAGIPPEGTLAGAFQPRIYFGESSPKFSIVGAAPGAQPRELDFPNNSSIGQQNFSYTGNGGVKVGSGWRQLLYALYFKDKNVFLSSGVNSHSQILYVRDPRARVEKVAPFLTLDGDPYPAIVNGRIDWIVDGYTTSDGFPYSARQSLSGATANTLTTKRSVSGQSSNEINYIRNSVKATVDAYTGAVTLYAWDPQDPVLRTWEKAFPGLVKPRTSIPLALKAHFRYPEDLFDVQRTLLTQYHVTNPHSFYTGTDFWKIPADPTTRTTDQPPYYLTLAMPGQSSASFQLTSTLLQNNNKTLASFVSVESDPSSPSYGQITVLQLPDNAQVDGPGQVANEFESFPDASTQLALLRRGGSDVDLGNLLTLPLGGGFLYVEPIYVRSTAATSFPILKRVLASYNGTIAYEPSLTKALDVVFGAAAPSIPTGPTGPSGPAQPPPTTPSRGSPALRAAVADAQAAYAAGQAALAKSPPDFAAYGAAQARLKRDLAQIASLSSGSGGGSGSAPPSPRASPSASP